MARRPERPRIWRGPFTTKRGGRHNWMIVNRYGEVERTGYGVPSAALAAANLLNEAEQFCDDVQPAASLSPTGGN